MSEGAPLAAEAASARAWLFRGWIVVGGIALANFAVYAGSSEGSVSVFYRALVGDFGWSRARVSTIGTLHLMTPGLLAFPIGAACDRWGARRLALLGILAAATGFLLAARGTALVHFYGFGLLLGLGECGIGFIPMQLLASRWFVRHRGLAMAVCTAGISLGGVTGPLLTARILEVADWRGAFLIYGVGCALLAAPALFLAVRDHPQELGLGPDGTRGFVQARTEASTDGLSVREAARTRTFWAITFSTAALYYAVYAISEHWVLFTTGQGFTVASAARLLSLYYFMGVVGRFFWGPLFDRKRKKTVALVIGTGMAGMVSVLAFAYRSPAVPWLYAIVFGFCYGGFLFTMPLLLAEYFGLRDLGKVIGASACVSAVLASFSPTIAGALFDLTRSYQASFAVTAVMAAAGVLLLTLLRDERSRLTARAA